MVSEIINYKTIGDIELNMHIFRPDGGGNGTLIVFFFCGGWNGFDARSCYPQATYFSSRGAVCMCAEVRVKSVHGTTPVECVIDAKSAIRWARSHAEEYGCMPERIVAYGSSAAGHVSACTALVEGFDDPSDNLSVSPKPNACVLFCPVLVIHHTKSRVERFGGPETARALSPILQVKPEAPPMLIFHGEVDDVVVPEGSLLFKRRMDEAGNRCELVIHPRQGHGYQGWFDGCNPMFFVTHRKMDRYLAESGFLEGEPTVDDFEYKPPEE